MKAYVVCCNCAVHHTVLDDEDLAHTVMDELAKRDYTRRKLDTPTLGLADYRRSFYWHLHETEVTAKEAP